MTTPINRDPTLGRAIAALPVPEHGPGFWDELRTGLQVTGPAGGPAVGVAHRPDTDADEAVAVADSDAAPLVDLQVGRGRRRRGRVARPRLALAAVAAAVTVATVGTLVAVRTFDRSTSDEIRTVDSATVPTVGGTVPVTTPDPTSNRPLPAMVDGVPPAAELSLVPGPSRGEFSGWLGGVLPGGQFALVSEEDQDVPASECGGQSLFVVRIADGSRRRVEPAGTLVGSGPVMSADGSTAAANVCETFFSGISLAQWGPDGSLLSAIEVGADVFPGEEEGYANLDFLRTLRWTPDGSLVMATGRAAYRFAGPDGTPAEDLGVGPALWVDRDATGRTAAVLTSGAVVYDGEVIASLTVGTDDDDPAFGDGALGGITGLQIDAAGAVWVSSRLDGVVRIVPGEPAQRIDPDPAAALVPTAGGILWISGDPRGAGPFVTRGVVDATVTDLLSHGIETVDPSGTLLGWTETVTGSDGTTTPISHLIEMRPAPVS